MRKTCFLLTLSMMTLASLAFAESWSGNLIDSSCYDKQQSATGCDATGVTKSFALNVSGKVYKLDASGNQKAASALKNRADRAADPSKPQSTEIRAKVDGAEHDGTIAAQTIEVQ
jgi:hypothetical protein